MAPEIPGMYYDETKKKYFKITPSHLATPGSKYSKEAIEQRTKQEMQHQQQILHHQWLAAWKEPVKRSRLASSAIDQYLVWREAGKLEGRRTPTAKIWAQGVSKRILVTNAWPNASGFPACNSVDVLAWDPLTTSIWAGVTNYDVATSPSGPSSSFCEIKMRRNCPISYGKAGVNSFSYVTDGLRTAEGRAGYGPAFNISPCNEDFLFVAFPGGGGVQHRHEDDGRYRSFRPFADHSRAASLNPRNRARTSSRNAVIPGERRGFDYAIASATGLAIVHEPGISGPFGGSILRASLTREFGALCVDWLDEHVVVAGFASGGIILYDNRVRKWVHRLQHPSAVIRIFLIPVDGGSGENTGGPSHQLLVAGLEDEMHMYDLRWAPQPDSSEQDESRRHQSYRSLKSPPSPPCISYPTYRNWARRNFPIAVSTSLGLIAIATPDHGCKVRLINLWTAQAVPVSDDISKWANPPHQRGLHSLMFVDDDTAGAGPWGPSLFIGRNSIVEEWSMDGVCTMRE